jgi:ribosomal protein L37E
MDLRLSLWENSKTFLEEAISKALIAESAPLAWKFAILALVQAIELAIKERLRREHGVLVFANVDKPKRTVSFDLGVSRLQGIAKIDLEPGDLSALNRAKEWRDAIVHADVDVRVERLKPVFARLLGFYAAFSQRHLAEEIYSFLSGDQLREALSLKAYADELVRRAESRLLDEKIDRHWVWRCRGCGLETFVVQDDICTCYVCGYGDPVVECKDCRELTYADESEVVYVGNYKGLDAWDRICHPCSRAREEAEEQDRDRSAWEESEARRTGAPSPSPRARTRPRPGNT